MKRLFTCIALVAMSIGAWAWTWNPVSHANGDTNFYLRCAENDTWLGLGYDGTTKVPWAHSDINNALVFNTEGYTWALVWSKQSLFYVDGTTNYFLNSNAGTTSYVTSVNDNNTNCQFKEENAANHYYRIEINNGDRYFQAGDVNGRVNAPKKASATNNAKRWQQIPADHVAVYKNRNLAFSATIANAASLPAGQFTAGVSVSSYELQNYADRLGTKSVATFTAASSEDYVFEGWYSDADFTTLVSSDATYTVDLGYEKQSVALYAKIKLAQTLSWDVTGAVTLFDDEELTETATATSTLDVTYSSNNTNVIKYENGAWVVVAAGEATIYADQAGNDTYEAAAQISKTITVLSRRYSKESGELAWNQMTTDNTKSMYMVDGTLVTKTPVGKHGTICLPYNCSVEGAKIYCENPERVAEGLEFAELENPVVEAGHAYIYFATADVQTWSRIDSEDAVDVVTDLLMEGSYAQVTLAASEYFLYTGGEEDCFHPAGQNVVMPAFRACIPNMPDVSDNAPIRLILPKAGVATGVENATDYKAVKALVDGKIVIVRGAKAFNVAGQAL